MLENSVWVNSLTSHRKLMNMEDTCETGPTIYSPYLRKLSDVIIMAALSPQLFKDPEC